MEVVQAKAVMTVQSRVSAASLPPGAPQPKRRRHRYIDLACDGCRARKKRCDRPPQPADSSTAPSCSQCLQSNLPCVVSSKPRSSKRQQCQQSRQSRPCPLQQPQQQQQSPPQQPVVGVPLSPFVPRVVSTTSSSTSSSDDDEYNGSVSPRSPQSPPRLQLTTSSQSFASTSTAASVSNSSTSTVTSPLLQPQSPTADAGELHLDMPCLISSISAMSFPYNDDSDAHTSSAILSASCGLLPSTFAYDTLSPLPSSHMMSPLLMFNIHGAGGEETMASAAMLHSWSATAVSSSAASAFCLPLPQPPVQASRTSSAASSTSTAQSSYSSTDSGAAIPAFCLQSASSLYIDTYLSLVNGGLYKYLDDASFRASYFEHHIAHTAPSPPGSAWLLCVSAVMAVGARMHGNVRYSDDCASVARYCARSIRSTPPSTMEDCALAYRALLVLSYYSAAMLCRAEVEWLTVAESFLSMDGARSLIPASVIHLHHLEPSFADVLDPPSDAVCEQVVKQQMDMYGADRAKYLKCKRLLRQQSSVGSEDDELLDGEQLDEQVDISADLASCSKRCQPDAIEQLNRSLWSALSTVHRRPSLCFSLYDCLITLLCAEAAVLSPPQRCTIYGMKLACYLLLGRKRQAVHAARDLVQLIVGMRQANTTCLPPFALAFVRGLAVLNQWDDSYDAPCLIPAGLRVLHTVAPLWPAAQCVEAQLVQRLRDASRAEMADATSSMTDFNSRQQQQQQRGPIKPEAHNGYYQLNAARLQRAMNKEMALQALTSEWDTRQMLSS